MLRMGCSRADCTPDFPVFLEGYAWRSRRTASVEGRLEVGALALEQDGRRALILTADLIGIERGRCRRIRSGLAREFGLAEEDIWICASHTHFAPCFYDFPVIHGGGLEPGMYPADGRYQALWMDAARRAVGNSLALLRPARLEFAEAPAPGIAFNRRTVRRDDGKVRTNYLYPAGHADEYVFQGIDERLSVWRFMADGRPLAILGRFGCHPVTGGRDDYGISPDYPGCFVQAVERIFGCPGFFLLGTAGDVVPMRRKGTSREDLGEILARTVHLNDLAFRPADGAAALEGRRFAVRAHLDRLDGYDRKAREQRWRDALSRFDPESGDRGRLYDEAVRYDLAGRYPEEDDPEIEVRLLRLGGNVLVGLPFEVLSRIGLRLSEACPSALVVSIAGGYEGYLPLAEDFPLGGYETEDGAYFSPDTGDRILEACIEQVRAFEGE